jgi:hypothetical protein
MAFANIFFGYLAAFICGNNQSVNRSQKILKFFMEKLGTLHLMGRVVTQGRQLADFSTTKFS